VDQKIEIDKKEACGAFPRAKLREKKIVRGLQQYLGVAQNT